MKFETQHIGGYGFKPPVVLNLEIESDNVELVEDILDFKTNKVPEQLIQDLRDLIDEFEDHNIRVDQYNQLKD